MEVPGWKVDGVAWSELDEVQRERDDEPGVAGVLFADAHGPGELLFELAVLAGQTPAGPERLVRETGSRRWLRGHGELEKRAESAGFRLLGKRSHEGAQRLDAEPFEESERRRHVAEADESEEWSECSDELRFAIFVLVVAVGRVAENSGSLFAREALACLHLGRMRLQRERLGRGEDLQKKRKATLKRTEHRGSEHAFGFGFGEFEERALAVRERDGGSGRVGSHPELRFRFFRRRGCSAKLRERLSRPPGIVLNAVSERVDEVVHGGSGAGSAGAERGKMRT